MNHEEFNTLQLQLTVLIRYHIRIGIIHIIRLCHVLHARTTTVVTNIPVDGQTAAESRTTRASCRAGRRQTAEMTVLVRLQRVLLMLLSGLWLVEMLM